jgi:hypothetical protein
MKKSERTARKRAKIERKQRKVFVWWQGLHTRWWDIAMGIPLFHKLDRRRSCAYRLKERT